MQVQSIISFENIIIHNNSINRSDNVSLEEKYLIQINTINTLKRDNIEMASVIKKMEEDIYHLKVDLNLKIFIFI
jgi:hypothetical protein